MKVQLWWILAQLVVCSQGQYLLLVLQGTVYINNSDILITEVGEGINGLSCQTSRADCCKSPPAGEWFYPNGQMVGLRSSGDDMYRNRDDLGNVFLNRRNDVRTPRGIYHCLLPDHYGVMTKMQVGLYLPEDYPSVTRHPESQSAVIPGSNVSFSIEAVRGTRFNWYFNRLQIISSSPRHVGVRSKTLTVLNVSSEDQGTYQCIVTTTFHSVSSYQAELTLMSLPTLLIHAEDALNVLPGSSVSFIVFSFDLSADYQWERGDGRSIPLSDTRFMGIMSRNLTITDIMASDAGTYVCVVSNNAGSVQSAAKLTLKILAPILVTPARDALEVPLGSNVTFSVFATGYNLLYLWELDSGESLPTSDSRYLGVRSSRLTISDVRTSDAGAYVCMVSNSGGSVRSTATLTIMLKAPVIEKDAQDALNVPPGSNVTFSVTASGYSLAYIWKRGNEHSHLSSDPRISGITTYQLSISDVLPSDANVYVCVVSNSAGVARSNATLTIVLDAPVIVRQAEDALDISLGSNVTFIVEATGHLLEYIWQSVNGMPLPLTPRFIGVKTNMLTIQNIRSSDAGTYVCIISNTAGTARSTVLLSISLSPSSVESVTVVPLITSAVVSWTVHNSSNATTHYELQYHPTLFPSFSASLITPFTSVSLDGLIPQLKYHIRVRVSNQSTWTSTEVTLDENIPPVENFSAKVINGSLAHLSWTPVRITGWNISYYYLIYYAFSPSENTPPFSHKLVVPGEANSVSLGPELFLMKPSMVHVFEISAVLAVDHLEGIGEVKGKAAIYNMTFDYEIIPFQVMFGPVDYCITWGQEKADQIRSILRTSIAKAVSFRCNCSFTKKSLGKDFFSCRTSTTTAIYRSSIIGYHSEVFIEYVKDWVFSGETVLLDWFIVDIYDSCPVTISSMHENDCNTDADV